VVSITKGFVAIRLREARNDCCYVFSTETKVKRANLCPLILVPLAFALSCGGSGDDPEPEVLPLEIVILGDSITVMEEAYVDDVADEFEPGVVWGAGRIGYTTRHWIPGWGFYEAHEFDKHRPRVVVILLGTNDAGLYYRIPVEEYIDNLAILADALVEDGVEQVLLMTAPHVFRFHFREPILDRLEQYAIALRWFCLPPDDPIECGPDLFELLDESDFDDGLHPNAKGHRRIADALLPLLSEIAERDDDPGLNAATDQAP
jgi:lysophospholipase L1-like esterase